MPIKRNQIVLSRYLFLLTTFVVYLMYLWLIDVMVHHPLPILADIVPTISYQPISLISILLTFLFISVAVAISAPVYYFFQSFIKSFFALGVLFIVVIILGTLFGEYLDLIPEALIVMFLHLIDFQPVLFFIGISFVCLYISYLCSIFIFARKDIA